MMEVLKRKKRRCTWNEYNAMKWDIFVLVGLTIFLHSFGIGPIHIWQFFIWTINLEAIFIKILLSYHIDYDAWACPVAFIISGHFLWLEQQWIANIQPIYLKIHWIQHFSTPWYHGLLFRHLLHLVAGHLLVPSYNLLYNGTPKADIFE